MSNIDPMKAAHLPPRTGKDFIEAFTQRESIDVFEGFSANAVLIEDSLDKMAWILKDGAKEKIYLPLEAGAKGRKVYKKDMTVAHLKLIDETYYLTDATLEASEIDDDNPIGRVWWRGSYQGSAGPDLYPMNLIEIHDIDEGGEYMKLQLVTDVPQELIALTATIVPKRPWLSKDQIIDIGSQAAREIRELTGDALVDEPPIRYH